MAGLQFCEKFPVFGFSSQRQDEKYSGNLEIITEWKFISLASSIYELINSSAHLPAKDFLAFNCIGSLCFSLVPLVLFPEPI